MLSKETFEYSTVHRPLPEEFVEIWLCPETWGMNASGTDKLTAQTVPKHPWQMDGEDSPVMSLGIRRDVPEPLRAPLHESRTADGPSVATA